MTPRGPRRYTVAYAIPPSDVISLNRPTRWQAVHRQTVALRAAGAATIRHDSHHPRFNRAQCTVTIAYPPGARRHDAHNLTGTWKPLLDGMVDAGLLPDDDDRHLLGPDPRVWEPGQSADVDAAILELGQMRFLRLAFTFTDAEGY